jgi:hypothetical protein
MGRVYLCSVSVKHVILSQCSLRRSRLQGRHSGIHGDGEAAAAVCGDY